MRTIPELLDGIVHEPTQRTSDGFDLTLAAVFNVSDSGRVDFGGDELAEASVDPVPTWKRNQDDDYEWWQLDAGHYLIEYNESLTSEEVSLTVQAREELLERGAFHPTVTVGRLPRMPLSVGGAGIRLKENARISTIVDVGQFQ